MTLDEVMAALKKYGKAKTKAIWMRHGCPEPFYGVQVADLKKLVRIIKTDTPLAKKLYATKHGDAMYLAGLVANGAEMTEKEIDRWAHGATWWMISEFTVPWVAAEHPKAWEIAHRWIESPISKVTSSGWATLSMLAMVRPDAELDLPAYTKLLERVTKSIAKSPDRVRYVMNGFVIGVGWAVKPLTKKALEAAAKVGTVKVDMNGTACQVPDAAAYIKKVIASGRHGKKRATIKC